MNKKIPLLLCVLLFAAGLLSACQKANTYDPNEEGFSLFYTVKGSYQLTPYSYEASTPDEKTIDLAKELYAQLSTAPDEYFSSVVPVHIYPVEWEISSAGVLRLVYSEAYHDLDNVSEILFRAAVVKTLVQVPGVDYVSFYIMDQPLMGNNSTVYGMMNASSFVSDVEDAMENLNWLNVTLYYSDLDGNELIGEKTKLAFSSSISIEQVVVEQLTNGPITSNCKAAIPSNVDVISVSTKDGICYVNLDADFVNSIADCTAEVTLYSIVNSLCELSNVKKVQFQINGSGDYTFREMYSLNETYVPDLDLIADNVEVETESSVSN